MTTSEAQKIASVDDHESHMLRTWARWKIIWTIFKNIIYITLIVRAFEKASSVFESLVICLLLLILQSVDTAHTTQMRFAAEELFSNKRILFLLLKKTGEETEDAEETISELEKTYTKQTTLYYINLVGDSIVYLMIVWKVFVLLL
jgi:hypothetical protein